jgi:hypothetical protein
VYAQITFYAIIYALRQFPDTPSQTKVSDACAFLRFGRKMARRRMAQGDYIL